jgi:hypothetical protein
MGDSGIYKRKRSSWNSEALQAKGGSQSDFGSARSVYGPRGNPNKKFAPMVSIARQGAGAVERGATSAEILDQAKSKGIYLPSIGPPEAGLILQGGGTVQMLREFVMKMGMSAQQASGLTEAEMRAAVASTSTEDAFQNKHLPIYGMGAKPLAAWNPNRPDPNIALHAQMLGLQQNYDAARLAARQQNAAARLAARAQQQAIMQQLAAVKQKHDQQLHDEAQRGVAESNRSRAEFAAIIDELNRQLAAMSGRGGGGGGGGNVPTPPPPNVPGPSGPSTPPPPPPPKKLIFVPQVPPPNQLPILPGPPPPPVQPPVQTSHIVTQSAPLTPPRLPPRPLAPTPHNSSGSDTDSDDGVGGLQGGSPKPPQFVPKPGGGTAQQGIKYNPNVPVPAKTPEQIQKEADELRAAKDAEAHRKLTETRRIKNQDDARKRLPHILAQDSHMIKDNFKWAAPPNETAKQTKTREKGIEMRVQLVAATDRARRAEDIIERLATDPENANTEKNINDLDDALRGVHLIVGQPSSTGSLNRNIPVDQLGLVERESVHNIYETAINASEARTKIKRLAKDVPKLKLEYELALANKDDKTATAKRKVLAKRMVDIRGDQLWLLSQYLKQPQGLPDYLRNPRTKQSWE